MQPLTIQLVRIRYAHWGAYSGINQLTRYLDPAFIRFAVQEVLLQSTEPEWLDRCSKRVAEILSRGKCVQWYTALDFLAEIRTFYRAIRGGVDVVHYLDGEHSLGFVPALLRWTDYAERRPRIVVSFHQPPVWLHDIVDAENLRYVDEIIVLSEAQYDFFKGLVPKVRVTRIHHGVDTDFFRPATDRETRGVFRCTMVGSWFRDYPLALRVAEMLHAHSDIEFHFISPGSIGSVPDNVKVHHDLDDASLLRMYQGSDLLVLPLTNGTANNALLEGIACGLPAVVSDLPGVREYVPGEEAVRIDGNDPARFAKEILDLRGDPERLGRLSVLARKRAFDYCWRRITPRYETVYRRGRTATDSAGK